MVDWVSRLKPMPFGGKHLLLLIASPAGWGGVRGLWHSGVPFEAVGVHVFPQMMTVPHAHSAFDELGLLTGERGSQLQSLLTTFFSAMWPIAPRQKRRERASCRVWLREPINLAALRSWLVP